MANRQRALTFGSPLSDAELSKMRGDGVLRRFLELYAVSDRVRHFDDFLVDTINLDHYAVANGGGAAAASFVTNVQASGAIRATTGTAGNDTASASLIMPLNWYGDNNAGLEVRFKVSAVTSLELEVGFADAVPASNASVGTDIDTPTAAGTDLALLHLDTAQTLATMAFLTKGTAISAQKVALTQTTLPTAATWHRVRVQLVGNDAQLWFDGKLEATIPTAIEGGSAVAPWVYVKASNGTSKTLDLDYIHVWQDRQA